MLALIVAVAISDPNVKLNQVADIAREKLETCGSKLESKYKIKFSEPLSKIEYRVGVGSVCPKGIVARGQLGKPLIVLCPPFFQKDNDDSSDYLIHEYLHTQGLSEYPLIPLTSESITREVKKVCKKGEK